MQKKAFDLYLYKNDVVFEDGKYMVYFSAKTGSEERITENNDNSIVIAEYIYEGDVMVSEAVELIGYQMNVNNGGIRTRYAVESEINGMEVIERGLVYGLKGYGTEDKLYVGADSKYVVSYPATELGVLDDIKGSSETATNYMMTMVQNIDNTSVKGLTTDYYVRAYAKLSDGSYVYSSIGSYSIFGIAKYLYDGMLMGNEPAHNFLYDKILSRVDENYIQNEFTGSGMVEV